MLAASVLYYPKARQRTLDVIELLATGTWREEVLKRMQLEEGTAPMEEIRARERVAERTGRTAEN